MTQANNSRSPPLYVRQGFGNYKNSKRLRKWESKWLANEKSSKMRVSKKDCKRIRTLKNESTRKKKLPPLVPDQERWRRMKLETRDHEPSVFLKA